MNEKILTEGREYMKTIPDAVYFLKSNDFSFDNSLFSEMNFKELESLKELTEYYLSAKYAVKLVNAFKKLKIVFPNVGKMTYEYKAMKFDGWFDIKKYDKKSSEWIDHQFVLDFKNLWHGLSNLIEKLASDKNYDWGDKLEALDDFLFELESDEKDYLNDHFDSIDDCNVYINNYNNENKQLIMKKILKNSDVNVIYIDYKIVSKYNIE